MAEHHPPFFQSDFSRALDCTVCMERLDDPKTLDCHHSFCKNCIDVMIRFRADGSGRVNCPMRCDAVTVIDADKTTNDLAIPYQLKSVLEAYNRQSVRYQSSSKHLQCCGKSQCTQEGTLYCVPCNLTICQSCKQDHDNTKHNTPPRYYTVQYDRQHEATQIICKKHNTFANFYCCDEIICVYCKEREHTLHRVETTADQIARIKEVLQHPEYGVGRIENIMDNTLRNAESTQLSISLLRNMIQKTIGDRKIRCLYNYLQQLKREEDRLMAEYHDVTDRHMRLYPKGKSTDIFKGILGKEDFEILLNKERIACNIADFTKSITKLNIGLTLPSSSHPLGNLHVEEDEIVTIGDRRKAASVSQLFSETTTAHDSPTPIEKLKSLLHQVLPTDVYGVPQNTQGSYNQEETPIVEVEVQPAGNYAVPQNTHGTSHQDENPVVEIEDIQLETTIEKPVSKSNTNTPDCTLPSNDNKRLETALSEVKTRGISYIRDLCKHKDEDLILTLLQLCPSITSMKNAIGNTPLHFAALNGCSRVLSRLLSMDSDNIDILNALGSTPLHYAIENRHTCCVKALITAHCNLTVVNISGYKPLEIAEKYNFEEIITLIQEAQDGGVS